MKWIYGLNFLLAILLFMCILNWPYDYFLFIRYTIALVFFSYAFLSFSDRMKVLGIVCIGIAVLYQPWEKFYLGRFWWLVVDYVLGIALMIFTIIQVFNKKLLYKVAENKKLKDTKSNSLDSSSNKDGNERGISETTITFK